MHSAEKIELTILMPCLNEAETLGLCIDKALSFLAKNNIIGEVLIADNGSTNDSIEIAISHGGRVVHVPVRGYGAALRQGIEASLGKYVIMGDSDGRYDFTRLNLFVEQLRAGNDLVMGNHEWAGSHQVQCRFCINILVIQCSALLDDYSLRFQSVIFIAVFEVLIEKVF